MSGVVIGDGCVIGTHAVMMAGSTFGTNCVIADGA
ncbi:MAG: hypothetical protein GX454_02380, partial [Brooklawnia sp.]|nr:hypothetical protein [Brooklawnia sp.]